MHRSALAALLFAAALPAGERWLVKDTKFSRGRMSERGQVFALKAGESLQLAEHHFRFTFIATTIPVPGLDAESQMIFGDEITTKRWFIPAE